MEKFGMEDLRNAERKTPGDIVDTVIQAVEQAEGSIGEEAGTLPGEEGGDPDLDE